MKRTECSQQNTIEARTSLVWRSTHEENKVNPEQKLVHNGHNLVNEFFVDERISKAATDDEMKMSRVGESRRTKCMSLDPMNNENEETLADQVSVKERTAVEQTSMATADPRMRMSRAGESRRRIRRMHLDKASYSLSPDDASLENCLDGCPTIKKLSSVSQQFLLEDPQTVVDARLRSNSFGGSQVHNNVLRWKQSTWGGEEHARAQGSHCPPQYVMLHMPFSQHLLAEDNQSILHKKDIFPGNTKDLSPLRVKELPQFETHNSANYEAKLGSADLENSQEQSRFQVIGGSFSRIDTRSMKNYSNEVLKAPSSLPPSPLRSSRESHTALIFRKILGRGSRVSSEISTRGTKSWEPQRERTSKYIISSESVVCERCYVPRRPGATTQALRSSRESSADETGNSWWPFKWKSQSKELRHNKPFKTTLGLEDNNVSIKADEQLLHHRNTSSAMYDDYSLASRTKPARFASASNNTQTISSMLGTSSFAPDHHCIPTLDTEKFLLPPRRLNEPCT